MAWLWQGEGGECARAVVLALDAEPIVVAEKALLVFPGPELGGAERPGWHLAGRTSRARELCRKPA